MGRSSRPGSRRSTTGRRSAAGRSGRSRRSVRSKRNSQRGKKVKINCNLINLTIRVSSSFGWDDKRE